MDAIEAKVLHDRGTHLLVLPKWLPVGNTVKIGPPPEYRGAGHQPRLRGDHPGRSVAGVPAASDLLQPRLATGEHAQRVRAARGDER